MISQPVLPRNAADGSIMSQCRRAARWIVHAVMAKIDDTGLTLIFRMWSQVYYLPFSL